MATLFRTKPVEKWALRWTGTNVQEVCEFVAGGKNLRPSIISVDAGLGKQIAFDMTVNPIVCTIRTLEGEMKAQAGDWIISGLQGEFYPCKPDIFEATYEPV